MNARHLLTAGALVLASGALFAAQWTGAEPFPHLSHERLFPVCEGCHSGVVTGIVAELYPERGVCARCHDGERAPLVEWTPPGPRQSNLRFFHTVHREEVDTAGENASCVACHATAGEPSRMNVAAPDPALCIRCHAHEAESHLARTVMCTRCHVSLADAEALPLMRVAGFPRPAWHDSAGFPTTHAPRTPEQQASCSVCHARETCERCHVNADRLPQVQSLARDERVARLERSRTASYPVPASHADGWTGAHGEAARAEPAGCGNCHSAPSCSACHTEPDQRVAATIGTLPLRPTPRTSGVDLSAAAGRLHPAGFIERHGSSAASGLLECAQCHSQRFCSACHAGSDSRRFHASNFVVRHAADVFAAAADCQSCHNTETFCRDCHSASGVASNGRMSAAFHDGQSLWVLSHGQAARRGLEACASCHGQNDCTRCHSAAGGWGVSPHGPGFDAQRIASRNRISCQLCHLADPLARN